VRPNAPFVTERRRFLASGLGLGGSLLLGCSSAPLARPGSDSDAGGDDLTERGVFVENAPFVGESEVPLDTPFNTDLDGRLYTDLSTLEASDLSISNDRFYIRTRYPDLLVPETPWQISVGGLVSDTSELVLDDIAALAVDQGVVLLECSGNARGASFGLLSSAAWSGVPLASVLAGLDIGADATRVLVSGFDQYSLPSANNQSQPGASWVFSFADLAATGAFLALSMNGEPLPPDHGEPVRLVVPGWYGCTCIKWVNEIRLVDDSEPSTAQMREFASRTQQDGVPELASDFLPAEIDVAAMPVRVEKWRLDGNVVYRVVGIVWGGSAPAPALEISYGGGPFEPVTDYTPPSDQRTWSLWSTRFAPGAAGDYSMVLRVPDPSIRTRRLDTQYYLRVVTIDEV
jgi:DMSO/TMAO reductase YedYZ molybdopterin-dependent catalytic subunit